VVQKPVVQKAGSNPLFTEDPRALMERGEFLTDVNVIFGANKHEGTMIAGGIFKYLQIVVPKF
jgi:hypothetical protein